MDLKALSQTAPIKYRTMYERALRGSLAPRAAIKVKCLECCGWERTVDGVDMIGDCSVRRCPLWAVRPFQRRHAPGSATSVAVEG
jgi:hypothetical protein